jgi:hypothetical protein
MKDTYRAPTLPQGKRYTLTRVERVINAHFVQLATGTVYEYDYRLDPIDPCAIQVRRNVSHAQWGPWGELSSAESAAIALESLQLAQAREQAEREGVGV